MGATEKRPNFVGFYVSDAGLAALKAEMALDGVDRSTLIRNLLSEALTARQQQRRTAKTA